MLFPIIIYNTYQKEQKHPYPDLAPKTFGITAIMDLGCYHYRLDGTILYFDFQKKKDTPN